VTSHEPDPTTRDRLEWLVVVLVLLFAAGLALGAFAGAQRVAWFVEGR
jgi:hypothetical protein